MAKNEQGLKLEEQREYRAFLWNRSSREERLCSVCYYEITELANLKRGLKKLCRNKELASTRQDKIRMLHWERINLVESIRKHLNELNELCPKMYRDILEETNYSL